MNPVKFFDHDIERKTLAGLLLYPQFWESIPEAWFHDNLSQRTYIALKKFLEPPYTVFPTAEIIVNSTDDPDIKLFVKELSTVSVDIREVLVYQQQLFTMYCARKVDDLIRRTSSAMQVKDISEIVRNAIQELAELQNPATSGLRKRSFISDEIAERWERYKRIEKDPSEARGISYHIAELDRHTNGGMRIPHIVMFYAMSGGYKTRVKANLAYNFAFLERKDVMVVTLEVPMKDYQDIIDSRHSHLDFNEIRSGTLMSNRDIYYDALTDIANQKYPLYIVDIPDRSTSADLILELSLYRARFGKYPDIIVLDYVNEMEPVTPWHSSWEKYKNLGVELRWLARSYNVGIITSMQENIAGVKMVNKEKSGLGNVGEGPYFSNVCHLVIHLYQDETGIDETTNILNWSIKKNRYGKKDVTFSTFANPAFNYVGDREIHRP